MPTSMGIVFFGGGHYVFFKAHQPILLIKATYNYTKKWNGIGLYEITKY
jgi:hypothetical protein